MHGETPSLDAALVAAISAAISASDDTRAVESAPGPVRSAWRAAGRSVAEFDAYDAARHDRLLRRGPAR